MNCLTRFSALLILLVPSFAPGAEAIRPIEIRAVLQDPMNPRATFHVRTAPTTFNKLQLMAEGLSAPQKIVVADNTIALYGPSPVDADPKISPPVLATVPILPSMQRCLLVIAPEMPGSKQPYRIMTVDDTAGAFPFGESRVVNLTNVQLGMQAGTTKLTLPAGKVTQLPLITELNEYKMGQTNFYAKATTGNEWIPFAERQLQYLKNMRRIFIIHVTPGAVAPAVRTVVDHEPIKLPDQTAAGA